MKKTGTFFSLILLAALGYNAAAQNLSIPISQVLPAPYGNGSYTLPSGIVATGSIITTCTCTPGTATGYSATNGNGNIGGIFAGHTLPGYAGSNATGMLTSMAVAGRAFNGTSDGTGTKPGTGNGNLTGALGFWIHFSDSVLVNNMLLLDIDGTSGNPNREWTSVFGYNTAGASGAQMVTYNGVGGSKTVKVNMTALTTTWGTMVSNKLPSVPAAQLPVSSNVEVWRSSLNGPPGTGDAAPDDTTNQILFNPAGGRMVTDLFILYGLFDDINGNPATQASGVGPIVTPNTVPLALHITSFSGTVRNNKAQLTWQTADDAADNIFEIQRSSNGSGFVTIGNLAGNGNKTGNYAYADEQELEGSTQYRIKVTDPKDGVSFYSKAINLQATAAAAIKLYPNPVKEVLNLVLPGTTYTAVEIYNSVGQRVYNTETQGAGQLQIPVSGFPAGIYWLKSLQAQGQSAMFRFVIE